MTATRNPSIEQVREELLLALLPHVPFDGWSERAIAAGAEDAGLTPAEATLKPGGKSRPPWGTNEVGVGLRLYMGSTLLGLKRGLKPLTWSTPGLLLLMLLTPILPEYPRLALSLTSGSASFFL